jgi:hypothetical protein
MKKNLRGIYVEDILSGAVCDSIRRAERGVFRPEIPVFDLCIILRGSALTIDYKF